MELTTKIGLVETPCDIVRKPNANDNVREDNLERIIECMVLQDAEAVKRMLIFMEDHYRQCVKEWR